MVFVPIGKFFFLTNVVNVCIWMSSKFYIYCYNNRCTELWYGTAREQVYIKLRALAEFLRVLASDLRALARASQSLCSRGTCVHTPIARVRNTCERLSMHVRNTNLSACEQCKHVPRYVRIFSCTTSSSSF